MWANFSFLAQSLLHCPSSAWAETLTRPISLIHGPETRSHCGTALTSSCAATLWASTCRFLLASLPASAPCLSPLRQLHLNRCCRLCSRHACILLNCYHTSLTSPSPSEHTTTTCVLCTYHLTLTCVDEQWDFHT